MARKPRIRGADYLCNGTWPLTGLPCRFQARIDMETCAAHDPAGDLRPPPPREQIRCHGTNRVSGERCRLTHDPGGTICRRHGGNAPQVRKAAAVRTVEKEIATLAVGLVGKPVANPLAELARVAGRARAWIDVLEERVQVLLDAGDRPGAQDGSCPHCGEDLSDAAANAGIRYGHRAGEQIRGEIQLYERAMDRLSRILADIGRLKIDERLAAITSKQADAVIAALEAGLTAAGVRDPQQRTLAKTAASRELRVVR